MIDKENDLEETELQFYSRFDRIKNNNARKTRFRERINTLLRQDKISEIMARNFVELLDINPAYYWPRKYRYTLETDPGKTNPLTIKERNHFERNGYLVFKNVISKDILNLVSECPENAIGQVLALFINQRQLKMKLKSFCGESIRHIATMVIDSLYSQSFQVRKSDLNQDLSGFAKLAQHFYHFNLHPADRMLGCLVCIENSNQLSVCFEPASHQSSRLEIEMRGLDGELVHKVYEKPIRKLETFNEQTEGRKLVSLQPGDVFLYHPLLAKSIIFESQTTEGEIFLENLTSNLTESSESQIHNRVLALNMFFGSADLTKVIRNWGPNYYEAANFRTPIERIRLLDKLLEQNQTPEEENQLLKEMNGLQNQRINEQNDIESLNVQIYIGNSIVNLEQVLADAGLRFINSLTKTLCQ